MSNFDPDAELREALRELLETRLDMAKSGFDPGDIADFARERLQEMEDYELTKMFYQTETIRGMIQKAKAQAAMEEKPRYKLHSTLQQIIEQARKHKVNIFYSGSTHTPDQFEELATRHHPRFWMGLEASWLKNQRAIQIEHLRDKAQADKAPYPDAPTREEIAKAAQKVEQDEAVADPTYHPDSVEYHAERNLTEYLEHLWSLSEKES